MPCLFWGGNLIKGTLYSVDATDFNKCVFCDFLAFAPVTGKVIEVQESCDGYKLRTEYYDNGAVSAYDSIPDTGEGYHYQLSKDGMTVSASAMRDGEYSQPYYTVLSDGERYRYNSTFDSHETYTDPVCYTEAKCDGNNSRTYKANGIIFTMSATKSIAVDGLYLLDIYISNTSNSNVVFRPVQMAGYGSNGNNQPATKAQILTDVEYGQLLNKDDIVARTRDYVRTTTIEPRHQYLGKAMVRYAGNGWLAVVAEVGGVSYPFYFPVASDTNMAAVNNTMIHLLGNDVIRYVAKSNSANKVFDKLGPFPCFNIARAKGMAKRVAGKLNKTVPATSLLRTPQAAKDLQETQPAGESRQYSSTFIAKANVCVACIEKLKKANNAAQVYNACLTYYKAYRSLSAMRKSSDERAALTSVSQSFEQVARQASKRLKCSSAVMKAQLQSLR